MRYRIIAALVAVFAFATFTATGAQAAGQTLTVWLQVDAQNGWPDVVASANSAFEASHPGWTVNVDLPAVERSPAEVRRNRRRERHA